VYPFLIAAIMDEPFSGLTIQLTDGGPSMMPKSPSCGAGRHSVQRLDTPIKALVGF